MNIAEQIKQAGVVGAGGAGFPTHVKLSGKAEYLIINAAECEPLIETDKYICRTHAETIVATTASVAEHLGANHAVIALKGKYKTEIAALRAAIEKLSSKVTLFEMGTFYPAGDEQIMVQQVTGRSIPERGLPSQVGAVVQNVGTIVGIADALRSIPVTRKILSVVGEVQAPVLLDVPIGTSIMDCVKAALPTIEDFGLVLGGPMMGTYVANRAEMETQSVKKTTGNIIVLPKDHYLFARASLSIKRIKHQTRSACIQCRMCTDLCPRYQIGHRIRPHLVMRNLSREDTLNDTVQYERAFGDAANCCSCGVCELFACPMGLSPRKVNLYMKGKLRDKGIDVPKNETAEALPTVDMTKIPTERLIARLGLSSYSGKHATACTTLHPDSVTVLLSQHIGAPATCIVAEGDIVNEGQLIGKAPEGALSTNIHASISGCVTSVSSLGVTITATRGN